jgi:hypothetical protein
MTPVYKHCHRCLVGEGKEPQKLRKGKPRKKTKGRRASISVEKLTHLGEKTLKTNPGPPGWGLNIGLATRFQKNRFCYEISVKYSRLDIWNTNYAT